MLDFQMFECDNYRYEFTDAEKIIFKLKWLFLILLIVRIPYLVQNYSALAIFNMCLETCTLIIGILGVKTIRKTYLVLYCSLSEVCFFLSSYDICQFLDFGNSFRFQLSYRVVLIVLFVTWSLLMFYSIKLILDLFQTSESKPLLVSFGAFAERRKSFDDEDNEINNNSNTENVV